MLPRQALSPPTILNLLLSFYSDDWDAIWWGETVTVEIPSRQWTLVIGMDRAEDKWTASVNGVSISALPKAAMTAASQPEFCKSSDRFKYSETIRSVTHLIKSSILFDLNSLTKPNALLSNQRLSTTSTCSISSHAFIFFVNGEKHVLVA